MDGAARPRKAALSDMGRVLASLTYSSGWHDALPWAAARLKAMSANTVSARRRRNTRDNFLLARGKTWTRAARCRTLHQFLCPADDRPVRPIRVAGEVSTEVITSIYAPKWIFSWPCRIAASAEPRPRLAATTRCARSCGSHRCTIPRISAAGRRTRPYALSKTPTPISEAEGDHDSPNCNLFPPGR